MVSRERILEAAARVYARHGFKGATTRLIAIEAEVNEVTLFRTFGSKGALLEAVLLQHVGTQDSPTLPAEPVDPPAELREFIEANLRKVGDMRPLLIHTMGECDNRPEAAEFACRGRHHVHDVITTYLRQMRVKGMTDADLDVDTASVLLTAAVMGDVMGRPIVPDVYPPRADVAERYASLFLRAIGFRRVPGAAEQTPNHHRDETSAVAAPVTTEPPSTPSTSGSSQ
ncbi:MAG: acnR [Gemmatimonadetes bacterium]|jgi:AcrR family transcriptional regulator|nr:acnR [Gemmatimonadota bacterium]